MNLKTLESDLEFDVRHLTTDLAADLKAEAAHIADPSQCGSIIRRHFNGLALMLLLFVVLFIGSVSLGIFAYTWR